MKYTQETGIIDLYSDATGEDETIAIFKDGVVSHFDKMGPTTKGAIRKLIEESFQVVDSFKQVEAPIEFPAIVEIPPCPPSHPAMGDKTPEVIAWFKANHSEAEFEKRYGNRVIPELGDSTENQERDLPEEEEEANVKTPQVIS